jgi:hypothetical protein
LIIITLVPIALQVPRLQSENHSLEQKLGEKNAELQRLEAQLAPFKTIALERYTGPPSEALAKLAGQIELLQRLDADKTAKIESLERSLSETSAQASPPTIAFDSLAVQEKDGSKVATIRFRSSKNVPLGRVVFVAEVSTFSSLGAPPKIIDFWPSLEGGAFQSGDGSKNIDQNGTSARLEYQPMAAGGLVVDLTVTASTTVAITGNYLPKPISVEIR